MTDLQNHFLYMAAATFVAYRALMIGETPVACIFVDNRTGKIVSYGCNNTNESLNGTRHAEFEAIDKIMKKENLLGADAGVCASHFANLTVYVTIEPCVMCALALKQIGIKKVYFGAANERFGGNGTTIKAQGESYDSIGGIMRIEAIHLLRSFYIQENESAPTPKVKKNKEIHGKEFPPNLDFPLYISAETFKTEFGEERYEIFYGAQALEQEISPKIHLGYSFVDVCSKDILLELPSLDQLYLNKVINVDEDILAMAELLPRVDDQGMPYFYSLSDTKKRKIDSSAL
ncbi:hypothetical protein PUMCH_003968 [Australozyma saopauloensis]|uniref:CMP/dCMP-type deaminase domain-containing protein n=1 Tax=Australozyma saopauloensis TaxID=291208 RepID=A0AAX4HG40_9ASCO|nr:hypothetical protein PUMCH_003968 [[Candida] saopauloensis]